MKRHLLRALGWGLRVVALFVGVAVLLITLYLAIFDYSDQVSRWLERHVSSALGAGAHVGEFYVDLPNAAFELSNVRIDSQSGGPLLSVSRVRGELHPIAMVLFKLQLRRVLVEGLAIHVVDHGKGRIEVPGMRERSAEGSGLLPSRGRLALTADRIQVEDARFVYDNENIPWRLEASAIEAVLRRTSVGGYAGRLSYRDGLFYIKDRPPVEASVDIRFGIDGRTVRVDPIEAKGTFYTVKGRGNIELSPKPEARFQFEGTTEVREAALSVLGLTPLDGRGAPASFEGTLALGRGWHELEAQTRIPRARFWGAPLDDWTAELAWDRSRLEVTDAQGRLAGGDATLHFQRAISPGPDTGELLFTLEGASLALLTEGRIPFASRVKGNARLTFPLESPRRLSGHFEIRGEPPVGALLASWVEPLTFHATGQVTDGDLQIEASTWASRNAQLRLTGSHPRNGETRVEIDVSAWDLKRLDEIERALDLLQPERGPDERFGLSGTGRARGTLSGRAPELVFRGEFEGDDVAVRGLRLGNVVAEGTLSVTRIQFERLVARREASRLEARGEMVLPSTLPSAFDFQGSLELWDWPVEDLLRWAQVEVPLSGRLRGRASGGRVRGELRGSAALEIDPGCYGPLVFDHAGARLALDEGDILLRDLSIQRGSTSLGGHVEVDTSNGRLSGEIVGKGLSLDELGVPVEHLSSVAQGRVTLGGTWRRPDLSLEATSSWIRWHEEDLGRAQLSARVAAERVDAALSLRGGTVELDADAAVDLGKRGWPGDARLRWRGAELAEWARSFGRPLPDSLRLVTNGEAQLVGELRTPRSLSGGITISSVALELAGYRWTSLLPVRARLSEGELVIEFLELSGEGAEVKLRGGVDVAGGGLDLHVVGAVPVGLLTTPYPSVVSSGRAELSARVRGAWDRPSLEGEADLAGVTLRWRDFPQALGDLHGAIRFDNRTLRAPGLQGRFGGASVILSGSISLDGMRPDAFELRFTGKGVRLRYPEGLVATLDPDLTLNGTPEAQILAGRVDVQDAIWSREYDLAAGFLTNREALELNLISEGSAERSLANVRLDVDIVAPRGLQIRNALARIDAGAELSLQGTLARPALVGRMEARRGEVFFMGQSYDLVSGKVEFVDPLSIKPLFDLTAETRVRSYHVELQLTGTPEQFYPELRSDPPLRPVDILRLLSGAREQDLLNPLIGSEEEEIAGVGVANLLTERLSQEVGRRAERLFGLDRFSIDPFLVGQFANPTARVTLGKRASRDVNIQYSTNLNATTEALILVEYTPQGPVSWIFSRDEEGNFGLDLRFRRSF